MFGLFGLLLEHKHSWFLLLFLGSLSVIGLFVFRPFVCR